MHTFFILFFPVECYSRHEQLQSRLDMHTFFILLFQYVSLHIGTGTVQTHLDVVKDKLGIVMTRNDAFDLEEVDSMRRKKSIFVFFFLSPSILNHTDIY